MAARTRGRLHRLRHTHLAGFRADEYELYGLADRSPDEVKRFASAGQMHNVIRPALNDWRYTVVLEDKWLSAQLFDSHDLPSARTLGLLHPRLGRRRDGQPLRTGAELEGLLAAERPPAVVVKPVAGFQGKHVLTAAVSYGEQVAFELGGGRRSAEELVASLPAEEFFGIGGYVVQERLSSHPELAEVNPYTLSTLRVRTLLRADGAAVVTRVALRMGRRGHPVESFEHGGLSVLVTDLERGVLGEGVVKPKHGGGSFAAHPDSGVEFRGRTVPDWDQVLELSRRAARTMPMVRSVGWDLAITPTGPVLIEGNPDWEPVQTGGEGFLTTEVKRELAALGVHGAEAEPKLATALRRAQRRAGRIAAKRLFRWSGLDPRSDRWIQR